LQYRSNFGMYSILINEFKQQTYYIEVELEKSVYGLNMDDPLFTEILSYHHLTKDYVKYLDYLTDQLINEVNIYNQENQHLLADVKQVNTLFFKDSAYSLKGIEFMDKTYAYREEILKLVKDPILADKIKSSLDTGDITDRNGYSIKSLDYFFKD